jgi:hypothetical protein
MGKTKKGTPWKPMPFDGEKTMGLLWINTLNPISMGSLQWFFQSFPQLQVHPQWRYIFMGHLWSFLMGNIM